MPEAPRSYRIILPPAWVRIPVGTGTDEAINALLDAQFAGLPMDKYGPRRSRLEKGLRETADGARSTGGIDLVFPAGTPWQVPVSAGIVVSRSRAVERMIGSPAELLTAIASGQPDATLVETGAGVAVRSFVDHRDGQTTASTDVAKLFSMNYTWLIPELPDELLIASFSVSGETNDDYAPIVTALTTLVDVMLQSVTWDYSKEEAA